jgi:hypothetical protein
MRLYLCLVFLGQTGHWNWGSLPHSSLMWRRKVWRLPYHLPHVTQTNDEKELESEGWAGCEMYFPNCLLFSCGGCRQCWLGEVSLLNQLLSVTKKWTNPYWLTSPKYLNLHHEVQTSPHTNCWIHNPKKSLIIITQLKRNHTGITKLHIKTYRYKIQ